MKKKRALTLLEIMIVIFLITLITGTIGYNMRGTLDKGRAFRTEQAREQLEDLLMICLAEEKGTAEEIAADPEHYLKKMGLAKDPKGLIRDGWKEKFDIKVDHNKMGFSVKSKSYINYLNRTKTNTERSEDADEEE